MLQRISTTAREGARRGFTLIELIVVIIIIGIIAAIAVPIYNQVIGNSKDSTLTASAQAFDRNFLANAAFDAAKSTSGDPRVSKDSNGTTLSNSGLNALKTAYTEGNLSANGYTVCVNATAGTADVTGCTPTSANNPAVSGFTWTQAAVADTADYASVELVKAGHYACLVLGTKENVPGTVTAASMPNTTGTKC